MALVLIEKLAAAAFFGLAAVVLLVLYVRGVTDPARPLSLPCSCGASGGPQGRA
jgi:hypothetical protein